MNARLTQRVRSLSGSLGVTAAVALLLACGTREPSTQVESYLPEQLRSSDLTRTSSVRLFVGDSLWEYINGDAEIYHAYNFEQVETADYTSPAGDLVIDVYRFTDPLSAYGLYASIRPDGALEQDIGVAGFVSETSLDVVRGPYLVRLTSFARAPGLADLLQSAARELAAALPGTTERPAAFSAFPSEGRLPATDRYYAGSFLGYAFLTDIYAQSYTTDGDTLVLFMSETEADAKLEEWNRAAGVPQESPTHPFPGRDVIWLPDSYNGPIAAGRRGDRLAGIVNYSAQHRDLAARWLGITTD